MASVAPQTLEDLFDVSGRVVVVTGAASGIGRAVAAGLADLGAAVYAVDVAAQGLEELASARGDRGAILVTLVADVADEEAVRGVFEKALAEAGKVDVVFSNAGVAGPIRPTDELSLAQWHEVLAVNLDGAFLVGREAARAFKTGTGGKLIFTSSVWGVAGARGVPLAAYAASKGASSTSSASWRSSSLNSASRSTGSLRPESARASPTASTRTRRPFAASSRRSRSAGSSSPRSSSASLSFWRPARPTTSRGTRPLRRRLPRPLTRRPGQTLWKPRLPQSPSGTTATHTSSICDSGR
jgi:NAD(P)-dependent dehydrogenase (short-subunit alcohol dehydrogenase family)